MTNGKINLQGLARDRGCTPYGKYLCQVPMPIQGRRQDVDICIADIIAALNAADITTTASCCGHGVRSGNIELYDGRTIIILNIKKQHD